MLNRTPKMLVFPGLGSQIEVSTADLEAPDVRGTTQCIGKAHGGQYISSGCTSGNIHCGPRMWAKIAVTSDEAPAFPAGRRRFHCLMPAKVDERASPSDCDMMGAW